MEEEKADRIDHDEPLVKRVKVDDEQNIENSTLAEIPTEIQEEQADLGILDAEVDWNEHEEDDGEPMIVERPEDMRWKIQARLEREKQPQLDLRSTLKRQRSRLLDNSLSFQGTTHENLNISPNRTKISNVEMEQKLRQAVRQLQKSFGTKCVAELNFELQPRLAFQRWMIEQLTLSGQSGIIIKNPNSMVDSVVLKREIMQDIPLRLPHPSRPIQEGLAFRYIQLYIKSADWWMQTYFENVEEDDVNDDVINSIQDQIESVRTWTKQSRYQRDGSPHDVLVRLRSQCTPLFSKLVEKTVSDMLQGLADEASQLKSDLEKIWSPDAFPHVDNVLNTTIESGVASIRQGEDVVLCQLNSTHLEKLRTLYSHHNQESDNNSDGFLSAVTVAMLRYDTLFGVDREGADFHVAVNPNLCEFLNKEFDVTMEVFSSPFTTFFPDFCSPFPDIDCHFGSHGSFFDFFPKSGSFLAHPPFTEESIERTCSHVLQLLDNSDDLLTFIVIFPDWKDFEPLQSLFDSQYRRACLPIRSKSYRVLNGLQHLTQSVEQAKFIVGKPPLKVYFLQTLKAAEKYVVTTDRLQAFERIMESRS